MKTAYRKLEELLWVTGLRRAGLSVYRATPRGRRAAALQGILGEFYGPLLPENALVFDVGANVGVYSSVFSSLGARVVALEPNPDCVRLIQLCHGVAQIEALQVAAGPRNGLASMSISDKVDQISSMSEDWIASIQRVHSDYVGLWSRKLTVPVVTLDTVIQHFGLPYFVKIDVEGFEESVLDGLSQQPELLSFEFNTAFLDAALRCADHKLFSDTSVFNFALGDPSAFALPHWVAREELKDILRAMGQDAGVLEQQGDIFVKQRVDTTALERPLSYDPGKGDL